DIGWWITWDDPPAQSPTQGRSTSSFRSANLTVPSGAAPGPHTVTAHCNPDERDIARKSATFTVVIATTTSTTTPRVTTAIGTATADGDKVSSAALSVPGDAPLGGLSVTASCHFAGTPVRATTIFTVVDSPEHRLAMFTALTHPDTVDLGALRLVYSALIAAV